ncbi:MAG TPA: hypothetical protein VF278_18525 [Pirellulales bacterium]
MSSQVLIENDKLAVVQLSRRQHWLRLALWVSSEFRGGELVRPERAATVSIEGSDPLSSSYDRTNWLSGVTSSALYAFRALRIPRQRVVVAELAGRLAAAEMEALASAAAIAVSMLAERELKLPAEGWTTEARLADHLMGEPTDEDDNRERAH